MHKPRLNSVRYAWSSQYSEPPRPFRKEFAAQMM
jgi:hypothetical protein